eukprot:1115-Hanusia_phi.AAC.1
MKLSSPAVRSRRPGAGPPGGGGGRGGPAGDILRSGIRDIRWDGEPWSKGLPQKHSSLAVSFCSSLVAETVSSSHLGPLLLSPNYLPLIC